MTPDNGGAGPYTEAGAETLSCRSSNAIRLASAKRDAAPIHPRPAMLVEHALGLAELGLDVVPVHYPTRRGCSCPNGPQCKSPGKHPVGRAWQESAPMDPGAIREAWAARPWNVGLRTGRACDVLDIDGEDAFARLSALVLDVEQTGEDVEPRGPQSYTGRGVHYLFAPTGAANRAGLVPGVDWRGRGGMIVSPPSVHASGALYAWAHGSAPWECEIVPPPAWVRRLLGLQDVDEPAEDRHPRQPTPRVPRVPLRPIGGRSGAIPRTDVLDELDELPGLVARTTTGGRNAALFAAVARVRRARDRGLIDGRGLDELVDDLSLSARAAGLGDREIGRTVASALTRPRAAR